MNTLTPKEITVIQIALGGVIEDIDIAMKDTRIPFPPEIRKDMRDILTNAKSAFFKIQKTSGHFVQMDPYVEGDEKDFLTKQS